METRTKKTFLSKLIDTLKNTALYSILLDESAGTTIDSDGTDTMSKIESLAQESRMSTEEVMKIEAEFNKAHSKMNNLTKEVETIEDEKEKTTDEFVVPKEKLKPYQKQSRKVTQEQNKDMEK